VSHQTFSSIQACTLIWLDTSQVPTIILRELKNIVLHIVPMSNTLLVLWQLIYMQSTKGHNQAINSLTFIISRKTLEAIEILKVVCKICHSSFLGGMKGWFIDWHQWFLSDMSDNCYPILLSIPSTRSESVWAQIQEDDVGGVFSEVVTNIFGFWFLILMELMVMEIIDHFWYHW